AEATAALRRSCGSALRGTSACTVPSCTSCTRPPSAATVQDAAVALVAGVTSTWTSPEACPHASVGRATVTPAATAASCRNLVTLRTSRRPGRVQARSTRRPMSTTVAKTLSHACRSRLAAPGQYPYDAGVADGRDPVADRLDLEGAKRLCA